MTETLREEGDQKKAREAVEAAEMEIVKLGGRVDRAEHSGEVKG